MEVISTLTTITVNADELDIVKESLICYLRKLEEGSSTKESEYKITSIQMIMSHF